ncbi:hypothetical protein [Streptomyces sp. NPDC020983]|uniref:hypothetical protein n=1 Tax=Streptomyces sp. NPDC020983 TaxID=3365106 RepID=UPI003799BB27
MEEHQELASALSGVRAELQKRSAQLAAAYPDAGPEAVPEHLLTEALRILESVRYELDAIVGREHPDDDTREVYYPGDGQGETWRPIRRP